jgi:hypothetical protein
MEYTGFNNTLLLKDIWKHFQEIWGSHGGEGNDYGMLECDDV